MKNRLHLYFRNQPIENRFLPGDKYIVPTLRSLIKGKRISGIEKVFINLCKGLDQLQVEYDVNLPFKKIKPHEPVVVLGNGRHALAGYEQSNPIIAGIALMTHPAEWPNLFIEYPVAKYLQHSNWSRDIYLPYYGKDHCDTWPAGIDTELWLPDTSVAKKYDILVYDKIMWDKEQTRDDLKAPILKKITELGLTYTTITYGNYKEPQYLELLKQSRAMLFLCEHESQGFACCEALAMNVPVLAWDQGFWLDPNRLKWGEDNPVAATSIPFFDDRCGLAFKNLQEFEVSINTFWENVVNKKYNPRAYILDNLTLKKSAQRMLEIVNSVYK